MIISLLLVIWSGFLCVPSYAEVDQPLKQRIAQDILSRIERDFFFSESDIENIHNIMMDCVFDDVNLNEDDVPEVIVKFNWFADGRVEGIPKGLNYVRGAQDQGTWYVYRIQDDVPVYIGLLWDGGTWKRLSTYTEHEKFYDIETQAHEAADKALIDTYRYQNGEYRMVSSILYQFDEKGARTPIKVRPIHNTK